MKKLNMNECVEPVLFVRREIEPGASIKAIIPLLTVIEIQSGLNIKRVHDLNKANEILSESVNFN
jgi:hypothetical protein